MPIDILHFLSVASAGFIDLKFIYPLPAKFLADALLRLL